MISFYVRPHDFVPANYLSLCFSVCSPEGKLTLYCKGADTIIYERLHPSCNKLMKVTTDHLNVRDVVAYFLCVCWYVTMYKLVLIGFLFVTALNCLGVCRWWPPHASSGLQRLGWRLHGWLEKAPPWGQHCHGRTRGETWWALWRDRERPAGWFTCWILGHMFK